MNGYLEDLSHMKLFSGIEPQEIAGLLDCLHARRIHYGRDEMIIEEGSCVHKFGVMLSGHARSIKWDASDRLIILTLLEKGSEIGRAAGRAAREGKPGVRGGAGRRFRIADSVRPNPGSLCKGLSQARTGCCGIIFPLSLKRGLFCTSASTAS